MYENYCKARDAMKLKDADVVRLTGITKSTFSDWKIGRSKPKAEKLQKIASCLNVTVDYLLKDENEDDSELSTHDERDIAKDLNSIMEKLRSGDAGPASFDGQEIPPETQELFAQQLDIMLHHLKSINKEKYNPNKNKNKE